MSIEIFAFPLSPRAFKVLLVANHLGVDYTLRVIDPRKGDLQSPGYAAINPNMRMPTLAEDAEVTARFIPKTQSFDAAPFLAHR